MIHFNTQLFIVTYREYVSTQQTVNFRFNKKIMNAKIIMQHNSGYNYLWNDCIMILFIHTFPIGKL